MDKEISINKEGKFIYGESMNIEKLEWGRYHIEENRQHYDILVSASKTYSLEVIVGPIEIYPEDFDMILIYQCAITREDIIETKTIFFC